MSTKPFLHAKGSSVNCGNTFQKSIPSECKCILWYWLIKCEALDFRKMIILIAFAKESMQDDHIQLSILDSLG
jgi:hypothetical protein